MFTSSDQKRATERGVQEGVQNEATEDVAMDVPDGEVQQDEEAGDEGKEIPYKCKVTSSARRSTVGRVRFNDHWTLKVPSSPLRFRGANVRVEELPSSQIQLEEILEEQDGDKEKQVVLKNVTHDRALGIQLLRLTYSLVCLLYLIMLFIFSILVLLFLFQDLVAYASSNASSDVAKFVGTLLAVPNFILGLASAMTLGCSYLGDTWSGHNFLRMLGNVSLIVTEWTSFIVFLGVPIMTWIIALFAGLDDWWGLTVLASFCSVTAYYVCYSFAVIYYEIQASIVLLRELDTSEAGSWMDLFRCAILQRQINQFSGSAKFVRMTNIMEEEEVPNYDYSSFYSKMTVLNCCGGLYEKVDPPVRHYSAEKLLGTREFVTANTWSLEKVFCSNDRNRSIVVVRGPSALLPGQMRSSLKCAVLGFVFVLLMVVAVLVYMKLSAVVIVIIVVIVILAFIPRMRSTYRIYKMYRDVIDAQKDGSPTENDDEQEAEGETQGDSFDTDGVYQTYENYRVSRPSKALCWFVFLVEFLIFLVWPLVTLFTTGNYPVAGLFVIVSIISTVRYYLNPAVLVEEVGSFESIGQKLEKTTTAKSGPYSDRQWKAKTRLSTILLSVTRSPRRVAWTWAFVIITVIIIVFAVASAGTTIQNSNASSSEKVVTLPREDFTYEAQPGQPYPTCALYKGLDIPGSNATALMDYAFLSLVVYQPDTVQQQLDTWFGPDIATDEVEIVKNFREQVPGGMAPVEYRFITFPNKFGIVVVRGTATAWGWMTNAQLWSAAAFVVFFRLLLPFGEAFNPILHQLLKAISWVQSDQLERIAFYKQTTSFVQALKASKNYTNLHITGHSLGGGITIITGAQTGIPAIAFSGPNAMLSRETFEPPIAVDAINTYVFNVVPDRDLVPRADDLGHLYQRIQCNAPRYQLFGCHSISRTMCEIMYQCGSRNYRPVPCECATNFGYPLPQGDEKNFTKICGTERSNTGF